MTRVNLSLAAACKAVATINNNRYKVFFLHILIVYRLQKYAFSVKNQLLKHSFLLICHNYPYSGSLAISSHRWVFLDDVEVDFCNVGVCVEEFFADSSRQMFNQL